MAVALRGTPILASEAASLLRRAAAAAPHAHAASSRAAQPALAGRSASYLAGAPLLTGLQQRSPQRCRSAVRPQAVFKQDKESVQWPTVLFTFLSCALFFVPLVRRQRRRSPPASPASLAVPAAARVAGRRGCRHARRSHAGAGG
jgi:hypothetical protein